jgi:hypothetical protein
MMVLVDYVKLESPLGVDRYYYVTDGLFAFVWIGFTGTTSTSQQAERDLKTVIRHASNSPGLKAY